MDRSNWKNPVFLVSAIFILALVLVGAVAPNAFASVASVVYDFTIDKFSWFYLLAVFIFIIFLLGVALSKYGSIRLGADDEKPEFSFFTWTAMLFSAGFGAGLVFWGVAEPMSHMYRPAFTDLEPMTEDTARNAMGYSMFHWGMHQWVMFTLTGLVIAFLQFRKRKNGLISTALEPIVGTSKPVKNAIDILAVIATIMGMATSIGLGVLQMNGGLNAVAGIKISPYVQLGIIAVMMVAYLLSSTTGLHRGIRYLSNLNLGLALGLLLFTFFAGPTVFILETFVVGLGDYITNFVQYSLRLEPYKDRLWVQEWTVFYWAWVMAWSPFIGAFVARVSRGRTIREFIIGTLIIPPAIAMFWMAVFGGTAIYNDLNKGTNIAEMVNQDVTSALFTTFEQTLPFPGMLSVLAILLIFTFIVTSADSATYILASMTSGGSLNPQMPAKLIWGVLMGSIAGVLLFTGGIDGLETASLASALPFGIILIMLMFSMIILLKREPLPIQKRDLRQFQRLENMSKKEKVERSQK
ncbi:choline/carnitine/betaine transport [Bhargavaea beijingensis]|uniref:Choline/carnitine/betaine transport n=1 Tax=Bhargavaea beijingensis TaxID=426756 RepID=A0A1G7G011_9BACL|nr:BCCT family transporter [Bhargavaea beijingensis]SDE81477.1 choline/carnitine/betaine transport [Bhargavaea beijingensis]